MSDKTDARPLLGELRELTRDALDQAKIAHMGALKITLARRARVIAKLWGFDPGKALPDYSPELAARHQPELDAEESAFMQQIRSLDGQLLAVLNRNLVRLNEQIGRLSDGDRYIRNVRKLYGDLSSSRYFDHVG